MVEATDFELGLGLPAPRSPWSIHRILLRRGRRQLVFLPLGVLKIGRTANERELLGAECRGNSAAARHPFWDGLAVRTTSLAGAGLAMRRYSPVSGDDFPAVTRLVDERLSAMAGFRRRPMIEELEARPIMACLDAGERARLAGLVGDASLPQTSMHGDLHFLNFVRDGTGFRIIDWEHFDAGGSYAFDYIDYSIQFERMSRQRMGWADFLGQLDASHAAIGRVAQLLDVSPRALFFHYLLTRTDITVARSATAGADQEALVAGLRRRLALGD